MKWGGAVVSVLLLAVWVGSAWWYLIWQTPSGDWVDVMAGRIGIGQHGQVLRRPVVGLWDANRAAFPFRWWTDGDLSGPSWRVWVPLWMPAALALAATAAAWRLDMLARPGLCQKCGYDRAGLAPGSVCPECGTATVAA